MSVDDHINRIDWPTELRSHADGDHLRFASKGPHPFVWIAVPFALVLGTLGVGGIAGLGAPGLVAIIAGVAAVAFAVAVLISAAYSTWGTLDLERRGGEWIVTRRLASLSTISTFASARIRSVELWSPPPFVVVWPGSAGQQVRVYTSAREQPISIAAGLRLDDAALRALQTLFTPSP
jgi:hypothetical protein